VPDWLKHRRLGPLAGRPQGTVLVAAALAIVAACASLGSPRAIGEELRNEKIVIDYYEPRSPRLEPLYEKLRARRVLEELQRFLAPAPWPKTLRLLMKECPAATDARHQVFYARLEYSLTVCYQWFDFAASLRPKPALMSRQAAITGGLAGAVLHESALAMFDMFEAPVLGSQEDAADQTAAFIALQFNDEVAQTLIKGMALAWKRHAESDKTSSDLEDRRFNFAEPVSEPTQRMYNVLCIAYGSGSAKLKALIEANALDLPARRAEHCAEEYSQALKAFLATIAPNVNLKMMEAVQSMQWLGADDLN
jgi:hypothetical protein